MMALEHWIGFAIMVSLIAYALTGGADFGGGVWDLLATGPRARTQRELVKDAIAPIWEANHVWLIVVIVLLFVGFPEAFALLSTALHIPLTLMLIGIVLRGSAFVFHLYGPQAESHRRRWDLTFSIASTITPIMLGISLGATVSGDLRAVLFAPSSKATFTTAYISPWLQTFPIFLGFYVLLLFTFLAAVYLTLETDDPALQEDFRRRALISGVLFGALAWLGVFLARTGAPILYKGLTRSAWSLPFQVVLGLIAIGALLMLWLRRYKLARYLAMGQVTLVIVGWGLSQFPYLIVPDHTLTNTAAPPSVLKPLGLALLVAAIVLAPSFWYLFSIFKGERKQPH